MLNSYNSLMMSNYQNFRRYKVKLHQYQGKDSLSFITELNWKEKCYLEKVMLINSNLLSKDRTHSSVRVE